MKLSEAQKEAIRVYNAESGAGLSLRFSFLRVAEYNRRVFKPLGVALLPLPTAQQLQKAAIDERYYSKKSSMGRGDTPGGRGRGRRGRIPGGSKTPQASLDALLGMPPIAPPLISINVGALERMIEVAVEKAVEKVVVPLLSKVGKTAADPHADPHADLMQPSCRPSCRPSWSPHAVALMQTLMQ